MITTLTIKRKNEIIYIFSTAYGEVEDSVLRAIKRITAIFPDDTKITFERREKTMEKGAYTCLFINGKISFLSRLEAEGVSRYTIEKIKEVLR